MKQNQPQEVVMGDREVLVQLGQLENTIDKNKVQVVQLKKNIKKSMRKKLEKILKKRIHLKLNMI